ncbi:hypothetical protein L211DRAFT_847741 [Terfezia boudieri ATCC MYA-4762]|uniref:GPI anchored protein n=1 Tax=Terfezia boudieri ATCC MYA-4762 TaxID=1051890 RepID=A0A3N4LSV2_9PEZI|nr:hypothetical protein L211DRAFT_847741 [Terfezia boudieri ATCC MYA-4762]
MRKSTTSVTALSLLFFLFSFASATTPGNPKGDYLSTMPLAATLQPKLTTCPAGSTTCLETGSSTICCPTGTTCVKKQDINGVSGWGCCNATPMGATCPLLLSNKECALQGWVVCGGVDGKLKSATCCERVGMCREMGRGRWDCAAESDVEVRGNATQTLGQTTATSIVPAAIETTGGAGVTGGGTEILGLGMAAIAGLWMV